jgi:hypothetical protein
MNCELKEPFVIATDIKGDYNFFKPYMDQMEWTDTNKLYKEHDEYQETMYGREMVQHYVKHISDFDIKLKKFIIKIFKDFGVPTKDWRADFFLTKAGGSMPMHIDGMSKIAFLLPLSENTGPLICEKDNNRLELIYQTLTILNTQNSHGVDAPTKDRLLFRIAVHDVRFEETEIYKKLSFT